MAVRYPLKGNAFQRFGKKLRRLWADFILFILGWKVDLDVPVEVRKFVMVVAPHTSNMDFLLGRLAFSHLGLKARFMIKKELFVFPLGIVLRCMGGIPVDRKSPEGITAAMKLLFNENEEMALIVTPEGTRKPVSKWKKGFYHIAVNAQVPIALAYLDYSKKRGGISRLISYEVSYNDTLSDIRLFYSTVKGRHPQKFKLPANEKNQ